MDGDKNMTDECRCAFETELYSTACSYFTYHAKQRTDMNSYMFGFFAAMIAAFGVLVNQEMILAALILSIMQFVTTLAFEKIDRRNKFLTEQGEKIIKNFEKRFTEGMSEEEMLKYSVFSSEAAAYDKWLSRSDVAYFKRDASGNIVTENGKKKPLIWLFRESSFTESVKWIYICCKLIAVFQIVYSVYGLFLF